MNFAIYGCGNIAKVHAEAVISIEGAKLIGSIFQTDAETLPKRVPLGVKIVTPDADRIDSFLKETFGDYYAGGVVPMASNLGKVANLNPSLLVSEPLPVYLNPAVRP